MSSLALFVRRKHLMSYVVRHFSPWRKYCLEKKGISEMSGSIRAVIFDMDGVLVDSEALTNAAAIAMFKEKGLTVQPTDFLPFTGMGEERYIGGVAEAHHFPLDLNAAKQRTYEIYLERT